MKKSLIILTALIIFGSGTVLAQDSEGASEKYNSFKVNPLALILGTGKINYERKLGDAASAQLGVSYFSFKSDGFSLSGLALIPEYRFYVTGDAIDGFYLAPFFRYRNFTAKDDGFKGTINNYGGGAKVGYQWLMGKKDSFTMDLAFGGKYMDYNLKVKDGNEEDFTFDVGLEGFLPEVNFAIGFAF